jgi:hypothetical protein
MNSDVRAAAERCRLNRYTAEAPDMRTAMNEKRDDWRTLALAYLAEHPADDAEPISQAWLRSVGFRDVGENCVGENYLCVNTTGRTALIVWSEGWFLSEACGGNFAGQVGIKTPENRGAVRRLCQCLGITLKPE